MKAIIEGKNMQIRESLREGAMRRLNSAFGRFNPQIAHVSVMLEDINGSRGGIDKCCRINVKLAGAGEISVEATDAELHTAIASAAERAKRSVQRQLERRRSPRRSARWSDVRERDESGEHPTDVEEGE
jgi:putative sigma-54 modulation protein